ncbi:MAG: response regulator transcription factor [Clostridia bacterium]|jgi:DNA-binding response OmpR family regulator|nr:response regulator transcription factor [Clostridia bacterium]MBR3809768.1 response regulator transcription factor [Clostridia bacterium]
MKKVLIAEDEAAIREIIAITLKRAGYEVTEACDGEEALLLYTEHENEFDVVLLDIMMPNIDGLEVCKRLRKISSTVGIIMLTAKTQEMDKVSGLLMGADDYITKPFSPSELMARVDSVYRRVAMNSNQNNQQVPADKINIGPFELNLRNRTLFKNGVQIELTQVEFQIIEFFFSNPGKALSRTDILKHVWGESYYGDEKVVDVNMRRLRMKIEDEPSLPKHLVTVWGMGYKWN